MAKKELRFFSKVTKPTTGVPNALYFEDAPGDAFSIFKTDDAGNYKSLFSTGGVTSINATGASGSNIVVTGGPVTTTGTFTIGLASGYSIPTTAKQTTWDNVAANALKAAGFASNDYNLNAGNTITAHQGGSYTNGPSISASSGAYRTILTFDAHAGNALAGAYKSELVINSSGQMAFRQEVNSIWSSWVNVVTAPEIANFVSNSRTITGTGSITGGGDLSANRTLQLVNDSGSPGNNKLYRTNESGVKGWYDAPANLTQNLNDVLAAGNTATNKQMFLNGASGTNAAILTVAADGGYFNFRNGIALAGAFTPTLEAFCNGTTSTGFTMVIRGANTYSAAGLLTTIQNAAGTGAITSGNLWAVRNHSTVAVSINYQGNITGNAFIKSGGNSSQFLKADGSVDSNAYITNAISSLTNFYNKTESDARYLQGSAGNFLKSNGFASSDYNASVANTVTAHQGASYSNAPAISTSSSAYRTVITFDAHSVNALAGTYKGQIVFNSNNQMAFRQEANSVWSGWVNVVTEPQIANFITASSANTLTNKSGNISMWTNNAGYITGINSGMISSALGFTPASNAIGINTTNSLTGGGNLTANRTLQLVNDSNTPGNSKYYGTNGSGTKGWYDLPAGSGGTITGSGTTNYIPRFSSATALANSIISQSGTEVTVTGSLITTAHTSFRGLYNNFYRDIIVGDTIADVHGRIGIHDGTGSGMTFASSAALQIDTTTKVALLPRLNGTQILAIGSPQEGMLAMNMTAGGMCQGLFFYGNGAWRPIYESI